MQVFWARLASFGHLGLISDPLIVSKFSNESHDPKGQENKIYTIVKGRVTFYCRHTVQIISCSEVKYVLKKVMSGMKLSLNQVWDRTAALTGISRSTAQKIVEENKKVNYWASDIARDEMPEPLVIYLDSDDDHSKRERGLNLKIPKTVMKKKHQKNIQMQIKTRKIIL